MKLQIHRQPTRNDADGQQGLYFFINHIRTYVLLGNAAHISHLLRGISPSNLQ